MAAPIAHYLFMLLVTGVARVSLSTNTLRKTSNQCRYPHTLYLHPNKQVRDGGNLKWYIYAQDPKWQKPHSLRMVDFDEDRITVHMGYRPFDYEQMPDITYTCKDQLEDYKYILVKQQRGQMDKYQCVQFVIRSDTVVQWRMSAESEVSSKLLCDDNSLKLQPAPLVYYRIPDHWDASRTRQRHYVKCPLEGGYFISQWGNSTHDSTCRSNIPPTKLESECGLGEGIHYRAGEGGACSLPFTSNGHHQQMYCIASWEHEEFTFTIVVAKDQAHSVSCLRFPTMHGHSFTAHVFMDGSCKTGYEVQDDPWRRSITMSPHIVTSLCGDETQACVMTSNLQCTENIAKACRETCNTCPYPIPWNTLRIARQFHGRWVFYRGKLSHEVAIDDKHIEIPTIGKFKVFVENKCPSTGNDVTTGKKRYILVTEFENGCSPRLTAIEIFKRSDAVISLRLSQSWPIEFTVRPSDDGLDYVIDHWMEWCKNLKWHDGPIRLDDGFRTDANGWYNLIHKDRTSLPTQCTFPESLTQMHMTLASGVRCSAEVEQDSQVGFKVKLEACKSNAPRRRDADPKRTRVIGSDEPIGSPITVTCLAAFGGRARGTQYFVTRTTSEARVAGRRFMCWALDLDGLRGYLLPVSDCDDNSAFQVEQRAQRSLGILRALSTYLPAEQAEAAEPKHDATRTGSTAPPSATYYTTDTRTTHRNVALSLSLLAFLLAAAF